MLKYLTSIGLVLYFMQLLACAELQSHKVAAKDDSDLAPDELSLTEDLPATDPGAKIPDRTEELGEAEPIAETPVDAEPATDAQPDPNDFENPAGLGNSDTPSEPSPLMDFIPMPWDGKHPDTPLWNEFTLAAINSDGSALTSKRPSDISEFCAAFDELNDEGKKMFWIALVAAMAKFESSYRPETRFTESFTDSSGRPVISRGLLQLSYESAKGYGCPIASGDDLHDPQINLLCTIKILNRWVERDGRIAGSIGGTWRGGARYWSVLRKSSTLGPIQEMTQNTSVCKN